MASTKEWRTRDKSTWGDGPWQQEPDKAHWIDEETGFDCLIVRARHGSLCGYVGVPKGHPDFERSYNDVDVDVHGGLTFAGHCHEPTVEQWQRQRDLMPQLKAEAKRHPHGSAAESLAIYEPLMDDFEKFRAYQQTVAICHIPIDGRGEVFWFGFDCAHAWDIMPALDGKFPPHLREHGVEEVYRDWGYVQGEVRKLAAQLRDRASSESPR